MRRKPTRRLFKLGWPNVVLNWAGQPASELALIGEQYHRAARVLVREFAGKRGWSDLEAYPIVFNYRHALELIVKGILVIGNDLAVLLDSPKLKSCDVFKKHSVVSHIPKLREIFKAVGWRYDFSHVGMTGAQVNGIIRELERFDPHSEAFRYPVKRDGSSSVTDWHFTFSPVEFANTIDPILEALFGAAFGLGIFRDQALESRSWGVEMKA
ncbi:MAG: hypothetical protein LAN70_16775 [Acidobacteriia bacterium]|nr:hypothetical protein [Terriglobia bacterium]